MVGLRNRFAALILAGLALPPQAQAEQPLVPLPTIFAPGWALLDQIGMTERETEAGDWLVEKTFPPELVAAATRPFAITGYIVPVTAEPMQTHILLVRNTEDCPFCGSSGYAPVLEVALAEPIRDITEFDAVTVTGTLTLVHDPETMQTAILTDARLTPLTN